MSGLHPRLIQKQSQTMAPCLQEGVRLLQLSSLDFIQEMRAMLDTNPFLEGDEGDAPLAPDPAAAGERESWQWDGVKTTGNAGGSDNGEFDAINLVPSQASLAEHLHAQLNVLTLEARDLSLAHAIVDSLDDDGLLRTPLDEIAPCAGLQPLAGWTEMRIALRRVQSLEPTGVGARSLQECLRLQAREVACPDRRELVCRIVDDHLDQLVGSRDPTPLARLLGVPPAEVQAACDLIRRMDPRPGSRHGSEPTRYIVPDLVVSKVRGRWTPALNPALRPAIRFNQVYAEMFERHRGRGDGPLAGQLRDARWAVNSLQQRFVTILEVARSIVDRQPGFFEFGEMALKPMALRDVAREVGIHESTVSRVTNNKYVATRHGVFELKHFFSRAMTSASGAEFSGKAVRELVAEMIRGESAEAPLSDAEIARQLERQGLVVCRRTVTKYRHELKLPSAEQRQRVSVPLPEAA